MLCLAFHLGSQRYLLPAAVIERVIPALPARALTGSHPAVCGVVEYRAEPVPVVDLGLLWFERACEPLYSTRIVLVAWKDGRLLGLQVEGAVSTVRVNLDLAVDAGVQQAPGMGRVCSVKGENHQLVILDEIFPAELAAQLFHEAA